MFGIVNFTGFLASAVILNLTPGSDIIYVLSKSVSGGRKTGIVSALGIVSGIFFHTILAALGLSAILAASSAAFSIMKILGASYLIYMGINTIRKKESIIALSENKEGNTINVFKQGFITNALNPKVSLFFLALLPQYVSANSSYGPIPFLLLGMTFVATSTIWCLMIAFSASFIGEWLNKREKAGKVINKITGSIYIILGMNLLRAKIAD